MAEYASAQSALKLEIARQYPDVHLGTGYQWDQGEENGRSACPRKSRPSTATRVPSRKRRRGEAAARFAVQQAKVVAAIVRAVAAHRVAQEQLASIAALLANQQKLRETVEAQMRARAADQFELLNAQLELGAGGLTQLDGLVKTQQAFGALEDAVQRPLDFSGGMNSSRSLIDLVGSGISRPGAGG